MRIPCLKSIYPSPPEMTSIDGNNSFSVTFSTTGHSRCKTDAAEIPPTPKQRVTAPLNE